MDGTKMSKSKGNLIAPEHYYETVGADGLRLFHLFVGPPFDDMDWSEQTEQVIDGCGRFLDRLWRACTEVVPSTRRSRPRSRRRRPRCPAGVHRTIDVVTRDLERWSYNTAVAHCMELLNSLQRYARRTSACTPRSGARPLGALLRLLAPLTPHVTAELWEHLWPGEPSVHLQSWPTYDPELVAPGHGDDGGPGQRQGPRPDRGGRVDFGVGRRGGGAGVGEGAAALNGGTPRRVVVRPPRLVNVVV